MEKIIIRLFYADRLLVLLPELVAKCSGTTPFGAPFWFESLSCISSYNDFFYQLQATYVSYYACEKHLSVFVHIQTVTLFQSSGSMYCVYIYIHIKLVSSLQQLKLGLLKGRPPLWSSRQSSWLQIQRSGFYSWRYQIFWEVVGLKRGPLSLVSTIRSYLKEKVAAPA
jgi:hypothetical protein